MIPITDPLLFQDAIQALRQHRRSFGKIFKGRFIQIFLGLKFFQNGIPSIHSSSLITAELLQAFLDDLYSKSSRPPQASILSLFEGNFLARTGLVGPKNAGAQNTWRNNFNIQKGVGCYAPPADLASNTFLDENRIQCRYLDPLTPPTLKDAKCTLCSKGKYRKESHRKWLRIDPGGGGYAVADLQNIRNFVDYIAPGGQRLPIYPLLVALYHDADPGLLTRSTADTADFMADFNFSPAEYTAYFDDSPAHPSNAALLASSHFPPGARLAPLSAVRLIPITAPPRSKPRRTIPQAPVLIGTATPPPTAVNTGWEAEQYVQAALEQAGWNATVVSRQLLGYDIFAQKGPAKRYVEVKSSLSALAPNLTAREWQQGQYYTTDYVLALIENFQTAGMNTIYWIPDPTARCVASAQTTQSYCIPRGSWQNAAVPLGNL